MTLDNLVSKVLAAGLAAGVFLLWWPAHLPSAGAQWLVLRGLSWTLAFELLVLAFAPLERMAAGTLARRGASAGARRVRGALAAAPTAARKSGAVALAVTGLAVPALLLAHTGRPPSKPAPRPATVVRKVVVRREVVRREKVVVRAPAPTAAVAAAPPKTNPEPSAPSKQTPKDDPVTEPATSEQTPKPTTTAPADAPTVPPPADTTAAPGQDAAVDQTTGY
jgi:hypothetical protein